METNIHQHSNPLLHIQNQHQQQQQQQHYLHNNFQDQNQLNIQSSRAQLISTLQYQLAVCFQNVENAINILTCTVPSLCQNSVELFRVVDEQEKKIRELEQANQAQAQIIGDIQNRIIINQPMMKLMQYQNQLPISTTGLQVKYELKNDQILENQNSSISNNNHESNQLNGNSVTNELLVQNSINNTNQPIRSNNGFSYLSKQGFTGVTKKNLASNKVDKENHNVVNVENDKSLEKKGEIQNSENQSNGQQPNLSKPTTVSDDEYETYFDINEEQVQDNDNSLINPLNITHNSQQSNSQLGVIQKISANQMNLRKQGIIDIEEFQQTEINMNQGNTPNYDNGTKEKQKTTKQQKSKKDDQTNQQSQWFQKKEDKQQQKLNSNVYQPNRYRDKLKRKATTTSKDIVSIEDDMGQGQNQLNVDDSSIESVKNYDQYNQHNYQQTPNFIGNNISLDRINICQSSPQILLEQDIDTQHLRFQNILNQMGQNNIMSNSGQDVEMKGFEDNELNLNTATTNGSDAINNLITHQNLNNILQIPQQQQQLENSLGFESYIGEQKQNNLKQRAANDK
ncbi:UNKNOWN [Stylonychia lemnae]|uniref:Uncharacterized protein n=1 Tax=Stylonychia lemnae TaxID=5949 RepID=A0A077ZVY1_STYLE|nr:UNKNOWN [Stylonychia lemnae]|eukprot:CDW73751.1 UNKNOWN [Stylonychia lemnae]